MHEKSKNSDTARHLEIVTFSQDTAFAAVHSSSNERMQPRRESTIYMQMLCVRKNPKTKMFCNRPNASGTGGIKCIKSASYMFT